MFAREAGLPRFAIVYDIPKIYETQDLKRRVVHWNGYYPTLQSALAAFPTHQPPGKYIALIGVEGYPKKVWEPHGADLAEIAKWL